MPVFKIRQHSIELLLFCIKAKLQLYSSHVQESNVVAHVRSCHGEQKTFVCPEENCQQSFAHKVCFLFIQDICMIGIFVVVL